MQRLKVWCEGPTDVPMFKALLAQIPEMPDVLFDFVGGWPHLIAKDQQTFEHGCKEAFVVLERYGMVVDYRPMLPKFIVTSATQANSCKCASSLMSRKRQD